MAENYTWEPYSTIIDDLELCLPCAAQHYISDDANWITLTPENIEAVDFVRVRKAKHVIGVKMPIPKEIKPFGGGVTLDSSSGGIVRGFSYADPTPNAGVRELRDELTAAMEDGHKRALLIMECLTLMTQAVIVRRFVRLRTLLVLERSLARVFHKRDATSPYRVIDKQDDHRADHRHKKAI